MDARWDSLHADYYNLFVKMFIKLEDLLFHIINFDSHRCFNHHWWP